MAVVRHVSIDIKETKNATGHKVRRKITRNDQIRQGTKVRRDEIRRRTTVKRDNGKTRQRDRRVRKGHEWGVVGRDWE